jgi:hypothetical protein
MTSATDNLTITTNNRARDLVTFYDLPLFEQDDFDYVEGEDRHGYRFFRYRGSWYDSHEFTICDLAGWHAQQPDTFFSGILVRYDEWDGESVVVGSYYVS